MNSLHHRFSILTLLCLALNSTLLNRSEAAPYHILSANLNAPLSSNNRGDHPLDPGVNSKYRLGPGDRIRMSVFKIEGYDVMVEVLSDGTINLPRLDSILVWGLTLDQARRLITSRYSSLLRRPIVYLDLITPRPVRVTLLGEFQKPGFYTLGQGQASSTLQSAGPSTSGTQTSSSGWPTLVDAVQKAGGITASADMSRVRLMRTNGQARSASRVYEFNFLALLVKGDVTPNPLLFDGDVITLEKYEADPSVEALAKISASNFAPDSIAVTVVGEVKSPGLKEIRSNSPLSQAVMAAGDLDSARANRRTLRLLRSNSNGEIVSMIIPYDPTAQMNTPGNPILRNGDVVIISRNAWTRTTDLLVQAVTPLGPLLNAASLYRILSGQ